MIVYKHGDILTSDADVLVCPVNCRGRMGAGLAKHFRDNLNSVEEQYKRRCNAGIMKLGQLCFGNTMNRDLSRNIFIVFFPTKDHWKEQSKIENIEKGLDYFVNLYNLTMKRCIKKVAFPLLGTGLGKLDKELVRQTIIKCLKDLPIEVEIWEK